MSAPTASPTPDLDFLPPTSARSARPRRIRVLVRGAVVLLLAVALSGGVLILCPPALEAMSAMIVKPQPGAIPWNGQDRITLVAMGLTQRTTEPARTDTLLVMDIDPPHHQVNMLSVPRDLWVDIPGYGKGKLAIAYEIGGPRLAAYTLERALGIPVDYTLALTFRGFMNIVDAMGGVTVNVPQELNDPTYPCLVGYDYCPIDIKPGRQHMDGKTALEFVRERHAFAQQDLARVRDQQAFSEAMKHTLLSPVTWPRYPAILRAVQQSLVTNLPFNDLPEVGVQYALPINHVDHQYINVDNGMVKPDWSPDGQSILVPADSTGIPNLVRRMFSDPTVAQENAPVAVLNGTETSGAAAEVESVLQGLGFHVVLAGNADSAGYRQSEVIVNTALPGRADYTARRLQRLLNATLIRRPLPPGSAKVVIILGSESVFGQQS